MRQSPGSSMGENILNNWDSVRLPEFIALKYISPLSTILHRAFSHGHSLYDASLVYNLFTNQDPGVYTLAQLQKFKSDLDYFSDGWLFHKKDGQLYLQKLRQELFGKDFLVDVPFSTYWLNDGINHHLLGVLDARVRQWIRMKSSPESDLLSIL